MQSTPKSVGMNDRTSGEPPVQAEEIKLVLDSGLFDLNFYWTPKAVSVDDRRSSRRD